MGNFSIATMKNIKIIITIAIIIVTLIIIGFIAKQVFQSVVKDITQGEIKRITGEKTAEITQQEIDRITKGVIQQGTSGLKSEVKKCDLTPTVRKYKVESYYTGQWIDSHVHMPVSSKIVSSVAVQSGFLDMPAFDEELSIDYIVCLFNSEGISKTIGFFLAPSPVFSSSINTVKNIEKQYPGKIAAFYMPTPLASINPKPDEVEKILQENLGLFKGLGEIKFAYYEIPNDKPEDPQYLELYSIANRNKLVIMMHPAVDHKDEVERLLQKYPDAIFFLHGESEEWVFDLMDNYSNLYYQIGHELYTFGINPEHNQRALTKAEWEEYAKPKFNDILESEFKKWKPLIDKYPDRLTLGTDRWYSWHFDQDVGAFMEEFERSFLGKFDQSVQEKLAYKNAEKLITNK